MWQSRDHSGHTGKVQISARKHLEEDGSKAKWQRPKVQLLLYFHLKFKCVSETCDFIFPTILMLMYIHKSPYTESLCVYSCFRSKITDEHYVQWHKKYDCEKHDNLGNFVSGFCQIPSLNAVNVVTRLIPHICDWLKSKSGMKRAEPILFLQK